MKQTVAVVIPLYTTSLNSSDLLSLKRTVKVLGNHNFAFVCPEHLDLTPLEEVIGQLKYSVVRFNDDYFKNIQGYNRLMLSDIFYEKFTNYEYILICQTDVYVFSDELLHWCQKGYDYIGAPWIASNRNILNKVLFEIRNFVKKKKKSTAHFFKVGNGGFSLRKVEKMQEITTRQRENIKSLQEKGNRHNHHIEDVYFSLVAPTFTTVKIPGYKEAAGFCIDRKPDIALKINNNNLPFACHGFNKPKVTAFWKPILKKAEEDTL